MRNKKLNQERRIYKAMVLLMTLGFATTASYKWFVDSQITWFGVSIPIVLPVLLMAIYIVISYIFALIYYAYKRTKNKF
jgi:uncharacterized membrane protein YagU involved in acid resistance